ncbi:MAG: pyridoxal 5'-phosphate synthase glutaminase subunit PdxT [Ferrimicrobium sp.]
MVVGVIALQGDFREHLLCLNEAGYETVAVRRERDLRGLSGIVLPGGESTSQLQLLTSTDLLEPLRRWMKDGRPTLGTCAGMILMASEISGGRADQYGLGALAIGVARNGFGRQVRSFESELAISGMKGPPMKAVFIRAPVIETVLPPVEVLGVVEYPLIDGSTRSVPVVVRQGSLVACAFHPELVGDVRLHALAFGDVA